MACSNSGNGAKIARKIDQVNQMMDLAYRFSRKFETQEHKTCIIYRMQNLIKKTLRLFVDIAKRLKPAIIFNVN